MEDISNYQKIREDTLNYYKEIGCIFSPALNENVYFNAEGFNHIVFKGPHSEREKSSQILRFKLLPLAQKLSRKIKTIIRKVGNGNVCFWSIIPAWTTNKYRDIRFYTTMKGNPEED